MERWVGKTAIVTGAGHGIGAATSKMFVETGLVVIGVDIDCSRLQNVANSLKGKKGSFHPFTCDVTNEESVRQVFETINKDFGGVAICLNCAGLPGQKSLLDAPKIEWQKLIDVNVIAVTLFSQLSAESMAKNKTEEGHIINMSSNMASNVSPYVPHGHMYGASKAAVTVMSTGLRMELKNTNPGVRVTVLSPGFIDTGIHNVGGLGQREQKAVKHLVPMQCEDIVNLIEYIVAAPPHIEFYDIHFMPTRNFRFDLEG